MMRNKLEIKINENWTFRKISDQNWAKAQVPGCVHTDLLYNNLIADPFYGTNEKDLQWISDQDWEYKTILNLDNDFINKEVQLLKFYGLDTYAKVYVNGKLLIESNNMFHPWEVSVKDILQLGKNEILVSFESSIQKILPKMRNIDYELPADNDQIKKTSPYTRKAPYHYGWDWGPSFATCGIWQNVEIIAYDFFTIDDVYIKQKEVNPDNAKIEINIDIDSEVESNVVLLILEPKSNINISKFIKLKQGKNSFHRILEIINPDLWWPNGHGAQNMYEFEIHIKNNDCIDVKKVKIGLRDFKVQLEKDDDGSSFSFVVNGKPIFSKGANWIPGDSFTTRMTKNNYKLLLKNAISANMNTVRVWGGGIYESEYFYDLCDELGLIVWQDFMFACSLYPGDNDFLESVKKEAEYQIIRLRNHPSIALWCGNNEIAVAWHNWGWKEKYPESLYVNDYKNLFHEILPKLCHSLDKSRLYWPSSPGYDLSLPLTGQEFNKGDVHYWGVWHGGDELSSFSDNVGRFMSEYGMQSFPSQTTVDYFCPPKEQNINSDIINSHQKASLGNGNIMKYILMNYNEPKDFFSFIMLSQIMAGEALKVAVESHRIAMPYCMGSLYWQLNDCWPGASWSSLDYFGNWKALHYYAKKFFNPLLICADIDTEKINIYAVNDGVLIKNAKVNIELYDFEGGLLFESVVRVDIKPNASMKIFSDKKDELLNGLESKNVMLRISIFVGGVIASTNDYFFEKTKFLKMDEQNFNINVEKIDNSYNINIESKSFLNKFYILCLNDSGVFTDNYFNMLPGEKRKIQFIPSEKFHSSSNNHPKLEFNSIQGLCS